MADNDPAELRQVEPEMLDGMLGFLTEHAAHEDNVIESWSDEFLFKPIKNMESSFLVTQEGGEPVLHAIFQEQGTDRFVLLNEAQLEHYYNEMAKPLLDNALSQINNRAGFDSAAEVQAALERMQNSEPVGEISVVVVEANDRISISDAPGVEIMPEVVAEVINEADMAEVAESPVVEVEPVTPAPAAVEPAVVNERLMGVEFPDGMLLETKDDRKAYDDELFKVAKVAMRRLDGDIDPDNAKAIIDEFRKHPGGEDYAEILEGHAAAPDETFGKLLSKNAEHKHAITEEGVAQPGPRQELTERELPADKQARLKAAIEDAKNGAAPEGLEKPIIVKLSDGENPELAVVWEDDKGGFTLLKEGDLTRLSAELNENRELLDAGDAEQTVFNMIQAGKLAEAIEALHSVDKDSPGIFDASGAEFEGKTPQEIAGQAVEHMKSQGEDAAPKADNEAGPQSATPATQSMTHS